MFETIAGSTPLVLLDQRKLPPVEEYFVCSRVEDVADAIRWMVVRGAPAIGVTAAYGLALAALAKRRADRRQLASPTSRPAARAPGRRPARPRSTSPGRSSACSARPRAAASPPARRRELRAVGASPRRCRCTRRTSPPTARWAARRRAPRRRRHRAHPLQRRRPRHRRLRHRARRDPRRGRGRASASRVLADETRPFLQGARLTAWELQQDGIPVTVITDSMAAHVMRAGRGAGGGRRRRPHRRQRRHRQQDRHLLAWPSWRARTASPSTSPRRSRPSTSRPPTGARHPDRGARPGRGDRRSAATPVVPEGVPVLQPRLRRHARPLRHRHHHRAGRRPRRPTSAVARRAARAERRRRTCASSASRRSCDETAAAVVEDGRRLLSNVVASQVEDHAPLRRRRPRARLAPPPREHRPGGRARRSPTPGSRSPSSTAIAVTRGPGLVGSLLVGLSYAKALAWRAACRWSASTTSRRTSRRSASSTRDIAYPARGAGRLGRAHRALPPARARGRLPPARPDPRRRRRRGLRQGRRSCSASAIPAGPVIDRLARGREAPRAPVFPRAAAERRLARLQLLGLKSAVVRHVRDDGLAPGARGERRPSEVADVAAAFQKAAVGALLGNLRRAAVDWRPRALLLAGGVACNSPPARGGGRARRSELGHPRPPAEPRAVDRQRGDGRGARLAAARGRRPAASSSTRPGLAADARRASRARGARRRHRNRRRAMRSRRLSSSGRAAQAGRMPAMGAATNAMAEGRQSGDGAEPTWTQVDRRATTSSRSASPSSSPSSCARSSSRRSRSPRSRWRTTCSSATTSWSTSSAMRRTRSGLERVLPYRDVGALRRHGLQVPQGPAARLHQAGDRRRPATPSRSREGAVIRNGEPLDEPYIAVKLPEEPPGSRSRRVPRLSAGQRAAGPAGRVLRDGRQPAQQRGQPLLGIGPALARQGPGAAHLLVLRRAQGAPALSR